jgi:DNA-binding transcriptional regulator YhcF (GntR family)
MADPRYIADHLVRIAAEHRDNPSAQLDSFRRIASNTGILKTYEELTPEKTLEIKQFCSDFIASDEGKKALVQQKVARSVGYRRIG